MLKVLAALLFSHPLSANPFNMETYTQEFSIEFKTEAAAAKAQLKPLPLYHGHAEAFSSRWDDNGIDHLVSKRLMDKHHMKGTYFLNASDAWCAPSAGGVVFKGDPAKDLAKQLLVGGHSIGAHSLTHQFVPWLNRNSQFYEVMGCRIDREENSQSPINSYAFSFMSQRNDLEGDVSQRDFAEILARAGFYHLSEHSFERTLKTDFSMGYLICGDGGEPFDVKLEDSLARQRPGDEKKLWVVSMHAWAKEWGGKDFPKLDALYKKWGGRKNWWYCNQNEYAAYRYQYKYTRLESKVEGRFLRVKLLRPDPLDLNDPIPLSFAVNGVKLGEVAVVQGSLAKAEVLKDAKDALTFDLPHDLGRNVPTKWGKEAMGVDGSLLRKGDGFLLKMTPNSDLTDMRITFRMPLQYSQGVHRRRLGTFVPKAGQNWEYTYSVVPAGKRELYRDGRAYAVAQIDAKRAGVAVRAYLSCFEEAPVSDPSYPKGVFLVLGPFGSDQAAKAEQAAIAAKPPASVQVGGKDLGWWQPAAAQSDQLGPEIIVAGGKENSRTFYTWDANLKHPGPDPLHYVLWGKVNSHKAQKLHAHFESSCVKALVLNGERVSNGDLNLRAGSNDLRLLYAAQAGPYSSFSPNHYGAWFRLEDASGKRATGVKYELPKLKP